MPKKQKVEVIEEVGIERELYLNCPDHQIWLSFCNDSGAELFTDWWCSKGQDAYQLYCKKRQGATNG